MLLFFRRLKALRHIGLGSNSSSFLFHKSVQIKAESGSEILINQGKVTLGFPISDPPFASHPKSFVSLGKNSRLIFNGSVAIAPGATIRVRDNATVIFGGQNFVSHNLLLICEKHIEIEEFAALSWNVTLIDDDGHSFVDKKGRMLKGFYRPLVIRKNVGIQMNVQIPRGVQIGENSVISAGTILRQDVPPNCLAYQNFELRVRQGVSAPMTTSHAQSKIANRSLVVS